MITTEQIRSRLIEVIKQSGLQQKDIAAILNIKPQSVQQYMSGRSMPSLENLANLCKALDIDTNYILCQDD